MRGDEGKTILGNWSNGGVRKSRKREEKRKTAFGKWSNGEVRNRGREERGKRKDSTWKLVQWRGEKSSKRREGMKERQRLERSEVK